jgi:hypothetical protein
VKVHSGQGSSVGGATVEELEGVKEWAVLLFPTMAVNFIFRPPDNTILVTLNINISTFFHFLP